jgi:peptidoglycan hydrolase CwlO-like protein
MSLPSDRQYEPKEAYDLGFEDGQEDRECCIEALKDKISDLEDESEDLQSKIDKLRKGLDDIYEVDQIERDITSLRDKINRLQ